MTTSNPIRRIVGRHADRAASFVDQALLGVANLAINVILVRNLAVMDFAPIGVMIGLHFFVFSLHRGAVVLPFILDDSAQPREAGAAVHREWWTVNFLAIAALAALLGAATATLWAIRGQFVDIGWIADASLYLTLASPPLIACEFTRRAFYQVRRPRAAALSSAAYLVAGVIVAGFAATIRSPLFGALSFTAAGLAGSCAILVAGQLSLSDVRSAGRRWRTHAAFATWQALTSIPYNVYTASAVVLVGTFAGPVAAAIFAACRTLVSPAVSVVSAVDSMDKPRAARALSNGGVPALKRSVGRTRLLILSLVGPYLAIILGAAPWLVPFLLGPSYATSIDPVRVLAVAFFFLCLNQPSETMLIVMRASRTLLVIRCGGALAAILGVWWGVRAFGTLGAMVAFAAVHACLLVALFAAETQLLRRVGRSGVGTDDSLDR